MNSKVFCRASSELRAVYSSESHLYAVYKLDPHERNSYNLPRAGKHGRLATCSISWIMLNGVDKKRIVGYLLAQIAATVLIFVSLLVFDATLAGSSLAGGLIATVATGWFAVKIFAGSRKPGLDNGPVVVRQFYWGEFNKVVLTAALFVIAFVYIRPVNAAALLGTYFIVHITPALYELIVGMGRDVDTRNNNE